MKKLMMAVALVGAAAVVPAGEISWSAGTMTLSDGSAVTAKGDLTGYIFNLSAEQYNAYITGGYTASGSALSKQLIADFYSQIGSAAITKDSTATGKLNSMSTETDYPAGTYYTALLIVDNITADEDGNKYAMGNIQSATVEGALDVERTQLGSQIFGNAASGTLVATAWEATAVPEPFSGSLALLGMGLVALRRKMKKQKKA